jgi:hypothetical protein
MKYTRFKKNFSVCAVELTFEIIQIAFFTFSNATDVSLFGSILFLIYIFDFPTCTNRCLDV